jgi:hypothetical protein
LSSGTADKSLAVMQPYFLPYIGYFQLIHCVDEFVLYDDVQYMKGGWVNRNRILENGRPSFITLPVEKGSLSDTIADKKLSRLTWERTKRKLIKRLYSCYGTAPNQAVILPLVEEILDFEEDDLAAFLENSLKIVCSYIGITTPMLRSSRLPESHGHLRGGDRLLNICMERRAAIYVNAIGGQDLYSKGEFFANGIRLKFLRPEPSPYPQHTAEHVPLLSILDVMMFRSRDAIQGMLNEYSMV